MNASITIDTDGRDDTWWLVSKPKLVEKYSPGKMDNLIGYQYQGLALPTYKKNCLGYRDAIEHRICQWMKMFPKGTKFIRYESDGIIKVEVVESV